MGPNLNRKPDHLYPQLPKFIQHFPENGVSINDSVGYVLKKKFGHIKDEGWFLGSE
jgi:hypothetical protein